MTDVKQLLREHYKTFAFGESGDPDPNSYHTGHLMGREVMQIMYANQPGYNITTRALGYSLIFCLALNNEQKKQIASHVTTILNREGVQILSAYVWDIGDDKVDHTGMTFKVPVEDRHKIEPIIQMIHWEALHQFPARVEGNRSAPVVRHEPAPGGNS